jgi:dolichol-phosphate mannosyltransferase
VLLENDINYELIFIDDGSVDNTLQELEKIANTDDQLSIISLSRNFGHQYALTAGMDHAIGDGVIVMDSDLQHPPSIIPKMLDCYQAGIDIVYAVRSDYKKEKFLKRISSRIFYQLFKQLANVEIIPGSADFRFMRREVIDSVQKMRETHRFLRGMVPWTGWTSATIPYEQPERKSGQASYTLKKSLRLARHGVFSFSTIPLELITWLGLLISFLGGIYLLYILIISLLGIAVQGWTSTIITILILGGIQLLSLGIAAQYIGMIFEEVKDRPLYIVKSTLWSKRRQEGNPEHD